MEVQRIRRELEAERQARGQEYTALRDKLRSLTMMHQSTEDSLIRHRLQGGSQPGPDGGAAAATTALDAAPSREADAGGDGVSAEPVVVAKAVCVVRPPPVIRHSEHLALLTERCQELERIVNFQQKALEDLWEERTADTRANNDHKEQATARIAALERDAAELVKALEASEAEGRLERRRGRDALHCAIDDGARAVAELHAERDAHSATRAALDKAVRSEAKLKADIEHLQTQLRFGRGGANAGDLVALLKKERESRHAADTAAEEARLRCEQAEATTAAAQEEFEVFPPACHPRAAHSHLAGCLTQVARMFPHAAAPPTPAGPCAPCGGIARVSDGATRRTATLPAG